MEENQLGGYYSNPDKTECCLGHSSYAVSHEKWSDFIYIFEGRAKRSFQVEGGLQRKMRGKDDTNILGFKQ